MRVLDSHLHLWDPEVLEYPWLEGPLLARFAAAEIAAASVAGATEERSVFVQADPVAGRELDEVRWVESIADAVGVVGIVAGARLDHGGELVEHLDALGRHERVVGVRHLLQGEPDGFARRAEVLDGAREVAARGLTFDACVRADQLPDVTALAEAVPELRIALDHLGKPVIAAADAAFGPDATWIRDLGDLAGRAQVHVKLSGLPAEAAGRIDAQRMAPFLDVAADLFGEDRLMWGSDWPVSSVDSADPGHARFVGGGRDAWSALVLGWAERRGLDTEKLFWSNARRFYGIR